MAEKMDIGALLALMRRLRNPEGGCPWDLEQDFASIAPYTIEEAYEVAAAIERGAETGDYSGLKDELGDLLFQVIFHAQLAEEKELFSFSDVVSAICEKMVRRHPHVFAGTNAQDPEQVRLNWEAIKARERQEKSDDGQTAFLNEVPRALPALTRAVKLQDRAARVGFDWPSATNVTDKIAEEASELVEAAKSGNRPAVAEEFGDLLFVLANLARHLKLDPEDALRAANAKFVRRFRFIEDTLRVQGKRPEDTSLAEMEALWQQAKKAEGY